MYKADSNRYKYASYNRCGKSGLLLPKVSLGLWHNFGTHDDVEKMKEMLFIAFDNGITHFDVANNYGPEPGSAETNLGKILKYDFMGHRDELIISTKAGYTMWDGPYGDFGSRKYLLTSLDQSLKRMGLNYVDIFYHHRMDKNTPLEESMGALDTAVKSGKAIYAGISNYDKATTAKAVKILKHLNCPFVINQVKYSILDRHIEEDGLKEFAKEAGVGLIAFSPLAQGLLTERYLHGIPQDSRVKTSGKFLKEESITQEKMRIIKKLNEIARERGQTLAQMSLSWALRDSSVCSVLIGASKATQIMENLKLKETFSEEELKAIDEVTNYKN